MVKLAKRVAQGRRHPYNCERLIPICHGLSDGIGQATAAPA
jgi:hypothetical protein